MNLRVLLVLGAASIENTLAVRALVLVRLGARIQSHEGRSGVIAQLGEVLNMGPVVLRADIGAVQKLGERGTENLELNAHKKRRTHASHNHG